MSRAKLNFIIDGLAFAGFVFLIATGFLVRYALPSGSGGSNGVGTGSRAADKPVTVLWGLTRHEWGDIHFWIALGLMIVLAVHLVLHWRWIVSVVRGRPREGSGIRVALGIIGVVALLIGAIAPFLSPKEQVPRSQLKEQLETLPMREGTEEHIRGSMTLREVEHLTGTPVGHLVRELGLPQNISSDEQLGQLRRKYGFELEDVQRIVTNYKK